MSAGRSIKFWVPAVIYACLIFYVSSLSRVPTPFTGLNFDKFIHFGEYGLFGILISLGWIYGSGLSSRKGAFLWAVVVVMLYGMSDEWHQSFVPGRDANIFDWIADSLGGSAGAFWFTFLRKNKI